MRKLVDFSLAAISATGIAAPGGVVVAQGVHGNGMRSHDDVNMQSPTLGFFFLHGDETLSGVEATVEGPVVVQTSDNPEPVQALRRQAAEASEWQAAA